MVGGIWMKKYITLKGTDTSDSHMWIIVLHNNSVFEFLEYSFYVILYPF